ncbi:MAG: trypsin-like peptidase domain-containing protein [Dehalococcoidia bacterium]
MTAVPPSPTAVPPTAPSPAPTQPALGAVVAVDPSWRAAVPRVVVARDRGGRVLDGSSWGSGVVVGQRLVVTAFHVAAPGAEFRLEFPGGTVVEARLASGHPESDIALLVSAVDLPATPRSLTIVPPPPGLTSYVVGYKPGYPDPPAARTASMAGLGGPIPLYQPYGARTYSTLMFDSSAGGGDSGGAMYDGRGGLIGIVVGGSDDPATGRRLTHVVPAALVQAAMTP